MTNPLHIDELAVYRAVYKWKFQRDIRLGKKCRSPFKEKDRHPSFAIYRGTSGSILFKDHSLGISGDVITFVMKVYNVPYAEAIEYIKTNNYANAIEAGPNYNIFHIRKKVFGEYLLKDFSAEELSYMKQFGIIHSTLDMYRCKAASWYEYFLDDDKEPHTGGLVPQIKHKVMSVDGNPIFFFPIGKRMRFYRPMAKGLKHMANTMADDLFGFDYFGPEEDAFMTSGQKDPMSLYSITGIPCFSLNSESATLTPQLYLKIKRKFKNIIICYDNDEAGITNTKRLQEKFPLRSLDLPSIGQGKDIAEVIGKLLKTKSKKEIKWQILNQLKATSKTAGSC